jgi:hypothetical protein
MLKVMPREEKKISVLVIMDGSYKIKNGQFRILEE